MENKKIPFKRRGSIIWGRRRIACCLTRKWTPFSLIRIGFFGIRISKGLHWIGLACSKVIGPGFSKEFGWLWA